MSTHHCSLMALLCEKITLSEGPCPRNSSQELLYLFLLLGGLEPGVDGEGNVLLMAEEKYIRYLFVTPWLYPVLHVAFREHTQMSRDLTSNPAHSCICLVLINIIDCFFSLLPIYKIRCNFM